MSLDQKLHRAIDAHVQGRFDEAEKLYREVLKKRPKDVLALHYVGVILHHRGAFDEAITSIRKSLALNQNSPEAHSNLGLALAAQCKLDEAIDCYRRSIELAPQNADSYNNLATALIEQNKCNEAIEICLKAISLKPDFVFALYNLGVAQQRLGKIGEAIESFQKSVLLYPTFAEAYCNLGLAMMAIGRKDAAIACYRKAIEFKPNFPEAFNNLGQPLNELGQLEEATEAYRQAVTLRPTYSEAAVNLAHTLRKRGLLDEAVTACKNGLDANPDNAKIKIELIDLCRQICDWSAFNSDMEFLLDHRDVVEPFIFLSTPAGPDEQFACARHWAATQLPRPGVPFAHTPARPANGRIRLGYLSCDFRRHATAYLMAELFERHDRSRFEIIAYSYASDDGSDMRQRLIAGFDQFLDIQPAPNHVAAQRIYEDKIDILIDLKGYTGETRTEILVNRPAPIQVNYVGYPGTMGADFIDYIIADAFVAPAEHQPYFSEKIVQLPHCYQPNDSKRVISDVVPTRKQYGLPEDGFVFCSFNGSYKTSPVLFDIWMRLLKAVPNSVLWLISSSPQTIINLRREAAARGIEPHRLVFATTILLPDHLARHRLADLFLDTLPINAHTTASDALWAGLPLLTCAGSSFVSRVAGSTLLAVDLPELITTSLAEYESRAVELARDKAQLKSLRERLARNLPTASLFDIARYTRNLEGAYIHMWSQWRSGQAPQPFAVKDE